MIPFSFSEKTRLNFNSQYKIWVVIAMSTILLSCNLKRICIPGEGNCLFASIAFSLVHRVEQGNRATIERVFAQVRYTGHSFTGC